jgi:hypothetical protein
MTSESISRVWGTILLTIIIFSLSFPAYAQYSGGTGEPNDPYQIATAADLIALGETPEDYDKHFILTADIDLDPNLPGRKVFDRAVIAPDINDIESGFQGIPFTGVFDGNDHTISHLTIQGQDYLGLFGRLGLWNAPACQVKNLGLEAVEVSGTGIDVGCLVGSNGGSISASYSSGSVKGGWEVGGLVGWNGGTITMSHSIASVNGYEIVGGLVSQNEGSIVSSYSKGSVSGIYSVGGLVGWSSDGNIIHCYSSGSVSGYSGIGSRIGGLMGENGGSIIASYSSASVSGNNDVGGLVGDNTRGGIASSYSRGAVIGTERIGGLVGKEVEWDIFGNEIRGNTSMSFWDIQSSGQESSSGGTGFTTAEMQDIETFLSAGWDFVDEVDNGVCDFWQMSPGDYPRLRYIESDGPLMPEGLGTAEQPYLIRDVRDLSTVWFKPMAHYCLAQSIDLSGITWSTAIIPWFRGSFDGNGYMISHLYIQGGSYLGIFGILGYGGEISNLGLEAVDVNGTGDCVGGLVGQNYDGNIASSYSMGSVIGISGVGGLAGHNYGNITTSYSTGSVNGEYDVGGLVGWVGGSIATSYSNASVSGRDFIGGLVGGAGESTVVNSYSTGIVSGNSCVGGLVGYLHRCQIIMSYSNARVSGNIDVGGLVGIHYYDNIERGFVPSCFWDTQTSGQTCSAVGTGKTTAEMQTASTFLDAGWDFVDETANGTEDIWWIDEGQDYPRLWWEDIER